MHVLTPGLRASALFFSIVGVLATTPAWAGCTTIVVGKAKTTDGSVLMAHNEDDPRADAQRLVWRPRQKHQPGATYELISGGKIPQVAETYAYIASTIFDKAWNPGDYTSGVNEFQVSVANNMSMAKPKPGKTYPKGLAAGSLIWTEFTQLVLERAKTAREGVQVIGALNEKQHLTADTGTIYAVADPNEAWVVEVAREGQWIARRVPDDQAAVISNGYRIDVVDLKDSKNILHSPNLVQHATENGWYDGKEPFDFAKVYGMPRNQSAAHNTLRNSMLDPEMAKGKISKEQLMGLLRWAYEDTPSYKADEHNGSPLRVKNHRTVACTGTIVSSVTQLRSWMPARVGAVMWWCMGMTKSGVYLPWYYGAENFSKPFTVATNEFSEDSAYWTFVELADLTENYYKGVIDMVTKFWKPFEADMLAKQPELEAKALALHEKDPDAARKYLQDYSNGQADKAFQMAKKLIKDVKTKAYAF